MCGLYKRAESYIKDQGLLDTEHGFRVVAGVSGGADSVCLLLILHALALSCGGELTAVHVNHRLRGDAAERDRQFVEDLCKKKGIPLHVFSEDVKAVAQKEGLTVEEAGRNVRYRLLVSVAKEKKAAVAVAHHLDDNAETVLFHLIRGSDLKGLSGIRPETEIDGVRLIRPLLFAERAEIEAWLAEAGQTYCLDATNDDTDYARNRIRHNILEEMRKINPQAARHIMKSAALAQKAEQMIAAQAVRVKKEAVSCGAGEILVDAARLKKEAPLVIDRIIYDALAQVTGAEKDLAQIHVRKTVQLLDAAEGKRISLPKRTEAVRKRGRIVLQKSGGGKLPAPSAACFCTMKKEELAGQVLRLPDGRKLSFSVIPVDEKKRSSLIEKNEYTKTFDYDTITGSLSVGTRCPGDRIALHGGSKTVNRFLIDRKIPRDERDGIVLLKEGTEVLWILGHRISETYKISDTTRTALLVTLSKTEA